MEGKVTIIMAAYNAAHCIGQAIESVIRQTYPNWELLVINDGSTDQTEAVLRAFRDPRIRTFKQVNRGVSAARNLGLSHFTGEFFCFLDSDDLLPPDSIKSRVAVFRRRPEVTFVDGYSEVFDLTKRKVTNVYKPCFRGKPIHELLKLSSSCFFGGTWMIRAIPGKEYKFDERLTHGEDLDFLVSVADCGLYDFVPEKILIYHKGSTSTMRNLDGLSRCYMLLIEKWIDSKIISNFQFIFLKIKIGKIMLLSYASQGRVFKGLIEFFRFLTL